MHWASFIRRLPVKCRDPEWISQNVPPWHVDYFKVKAIKAQQTQEEIFTCLRNPDIKTCCGKGASADSSWHIWMKCGRQGETGKVCLLDSPQCPIVSRWPRTHHPFAPSHLPVNFLLSPGNVRPLPLSP